MKKLFAIVVCCLLAYAVHAQVHPLAFNNATEFKYVQANLKQTALIGQSYNNLKITTDRRMLESIDVPVPKDAAGGYTHDQHKANYLLMFDAGLMYQLTGEKKYASFVKKIFLEYAKLNPTLKNHPQATSSAPGRLFWQALNDANWLVYAGLAFDCIHDFLTPTERIQIADGAFKPIVDYFINEKPDWFNLIHNHAVWACAGVGIVGIATDNDNYVQMALMGSKKDGKAGFLAQLDGLFSPDGFYNEGPYYTRYAVLPFFLFANAISHKYPAQKIFQYRNQILKKALDVALQQTNINGNFFSYNDALKQKNYTSNELVVAVDIAWNAYGFDSSYLPVARSQNRIILYKGGIGIAQALSNNKNKFLIYPYQSASYTDGADGKSGGVSVLRANPKNQLTTLVFKYTSHGLSHGHYDKLNIQLFDNGNEVIQDYGAVRYINIEQKWGGRYLPETNSYAQQTIAHNTITVDEISHFKGVEKTSEMYHPNQLFKYFSPTNKVQVVSALDEHAYANVKLFRTVYLIQLPGVEKPLTLDIFKTKSDSIHQYDLPFNYLGVPMKTNFTYTPALEEQKTLGKKNGYQHLWVEATAKQVSPFTQFTFLNDSTFYTVSSLSSDTPDVYFTRIGANDPNFNLRHDPSYILRTTSQNQTFVNTIEPHGNFNPVTEIAHHSTTAVSAIERLMDDENYTAVMVTIQEKKLLVIQSNKLFDATFKHEVSINPLGKTIRWQGPVYIEFDHTTLK